MKQERIIGRYEGTTDGPLLIAIGGMHGNEHAGVNALTQVFQMLEKEPSRNPSFAFQGQFIGLRGNQQALASRKRFLQKDMNRHFRTNYIQQVSQQPIDQLEAEDLELRELIDLIHNEIDTYQPERFILLDLHTTTADGGIFSIVTDDEASVQMGVQLHAPAIKGFLAGIQGTTLHYFTNENFKPQTIALTFEAGQHDDPQSAIRSVSAIINCLRTIGCVKPHDVEHHHDDILVKYSQKLPKLSKLAYVHSIIATDQFTMKPGYQNFQPIQKGELLAHDKNGPIFAPQDGLILMPLYQKQGEDGFFIIQEIQANKQANYTLQTSDTNPVVG